MKRTPLVRRTRLVRGSALGTHHADPRMTEWGRKVRERDRVCQMCGLGPGPDHTLEAAHVFGRQAHPALKYVLENGMLLGASCHRKFDANRKTWLRWVRANWPGRVERLEAVEREARSV